MGAPERIWLNTAGDYDEAYEAMLGTDTGVTWCDMSQDEGDDEYVRADLAAAQVAAAYERAADLCVDQFQAHLDLVITGNPDNARNRESAANMAEKLSHEIRALATDTQTDALERVRKEAALKALADMGQEFDADTAAAQVAAAYERGVREALSRMLPNFDEDSRAKIIEAAYRNYKQMQRGVRGQIITEWDGIESHVVEATRAAILALLDNPTPDPDEQTKAQDLAFRKAVSS